MNANPPAKSMPPGRHPLRGGLGGRQSPRRQLHASLGVVPGSWLWLAFRGEDCSVIRSQCAVRHLISHRLPGRQLSCVIFISIFYTPSIRKRHRANLSPVSLFVCLPAVLVAPVSSFHSSHPPGLLAGRVWGAGNSFYMLLQRPISKTSALRAAVLGGFPAGLRWGRVSDCIPLLTICS